MRLYSDKDQRRNHEPEITSAGRELIQKLYLKTKRSREDYQLGLIAERCLVGKGSAAIAKKICRRLKASASKYEIDAFDQNELMHGILAAQPRAALDGLFSGDDAARKLGIRIIHDMRDSHRKNVLDSVPDDELLSWCNHHAKTNFATAAAVVTFSRPGDGDGPAQWTNTALKLLDKAPDRVEVLKQFVRRFRPMSWSGSRAAIIESNAKLLDELTTYPDSAVMDFISHEKPRLICEIESERLFETTKDRARDERFE